MPPKKGKKGKKGGDDEDFWAEKDKEFDSNVATPNNETSMGGGGSAFDALDDDEDGGGGLMAAIAAAKNKKKDKKKKKAQFEFEDEEGAESKEAERADMDDEWPEDDVKPKKGKKGKKNTFDFDDDEGAAAEPEAPAVDDFANKAAEKANLDDEWPEDDVKPKKGKKGKKGKKQQVEEDDEEDFLEKAAAEAAAAKTAAEAETAKAAEAAKAAAAEEPEDEDEEEAGGNRILTKKEKEKLKKEKEKAKKKAQAAKKKAAAAEESTPAAASEAAPEAAPEAEAEDEPAAASSKNKKKKKGAKAEPAAPAAAAGKKVPAHILAMQAAMAEKKRLEEEAAAKVEAERRRIEENERRIEEEEARIAAAKEAKREKERLKRAQAKAEGRMLTPAQKRERAAAEARKQALLASGVVIAGLQNDGENKPKARPVYGKKNNKKQQQQQQQKTPATPTAPTSPKKPVEEPKKEAPKPKAKEESDDDWDKSEDEVEAATAAVKDLKVEEESEDDWDKSEDEEEKPKAAATPVAAAKAPAKRAAKAAPAKAASKAAAKPATNDKGTAKAPVEEESESEEETESDDESDETEDDSDEETDSDSDDEIEQAKERARVAIAARRKAAEAEQSKTDLRSPICCILGHVDTGKTKLLDKIRQTSVQEGEAGGITQQIGATFFPKEALVEKTMAVNKNGEVEVQIPGLLIIDTPGHESFTNLRSRGSSLCNIAILVIDITHGLEPQTIESLNLLKMRKTPFIVALNKIDKLDATEWKVHPDSGFRDTLNAQSPRMQRMFEDRLQHVKMLLMEQGLNSEVYDKNTQPGRVVSVVPTSAVTGEGVPDLLALLVKLTQDRMTGSLMYLSEAEATILEVKVIEGLGTTIDIVLVNGVLREGDKIVLCGMNGPIVTNVRALLTPQPMRELRIKSAYVHHKEVKAALGVKISAPGLEKAIAGARMYVAKNADEEEYYKDLAMDDLTSLDQYVQKTGRGVFVQASTLGSLEALLVFLKDMNIPVFEFGLGPVYKSAVIRAGLMLDRAPEYAVMLCFDVPVTFEAEEQAKKEGVKIFSAMIIYHLFDAFKKHMEEVREARMKEAAPMAVWPVKLKILKAFASKDPIIVGCDIVDGATARVGTPVGVVRYDKETGKREIIPLGKITSLEINHKPMPVVKKSQVGAGVAVKIERAAHQAARSFGRHFDEKDEIVSLISRQSLDTLKNTFRDQVEMSDWALLKKMKIEQGVA
ncbi:hypothetical protein CspeluHIS016_0204690 [Cutaneotrichosporon spelunceum]|uniref:Eukaryotic translation initiation factor 5B n=1 Tax=Cutaneotrichosporon spelunceum TaxID=1672016 RepID=A0AAD3TRQ9_9TREE|nr:hypothetical protein CspeluHIS016_0204690 [Cutaneotrichosporon spelunceum]